MANANASRPGVNMTAGKLEVNIPKEETIVKKADGSVVRRTVFQSGTIRETNVFAEDVKVLEIEIDESPEPPPPAKTEEEIRAEVTAELEAKAEKKAAAKKDKGKGAK